MKYETCRYIPVLFVTILGALIIGSPVSDYLFRGALASPKLTPKDWLMSEQSDDERFRLIQTQLRGADR
jgi:hypothetical protein